jgi:hypothetical protein
VKYKIDDIKLDLRGRIEYLSIDDIREIKHRIKELVNAIKDAAYIMLSTSDDMNEFHASPEEATGCGYDGSCFDRAFRICKPTTFRPESGVIATIEGLEGDACVLNVRATEGPPGMEMGMTCKVPDYSFGMGDPEGMIGAYCEGPMADSFRRGEMEPGGGPGGPGGCRTERECREYCERPENIEECKRFAEEYGFTGPEGCFGSECDQFCRENPRVCYEWCIDNPGKCPGFEEGSEGPLIQDYEKEKEFREGQACVGCLNNGVCDPGECSECRDCLERRF